MQLIKPNTNYDFLRWKIIAPIFSGLLILATLISLWIRGGPNYGIDFSGGILVQLKFKNEVSAGEVREALGDLGLRHLLVQRFGAKADNEYLVRVEQTETDLNALSQRIETALKERFGPDSTEVRRTEIVGPKVGAELRKKGLLAVLYSNIGILIYLTFRFEFRYALGTVLAVVHDALITIGVFSLLNREIDLPEVAAILTIIGYSVNDTIVLFDRVRENLRKIRKQALEKVLNTSINETLSRTILTSLTVLVVVIVLFFFGGPVIHNFALAMLVGCIVGTYSTVYIASPIVLLWGYVKERTMKTKSARPAAKKLAR
ncbi:MAG: protein translocase subunit SecF [bacterium]